MTKRYIKIVSILICILITFTSSIYAFSPSDSKLYNGIDVSSWQ